MQWWIIVGAIVVVVLLLIIWVVRGQNRLVHADELCGNALSQIGVQQASRWDALGALADLTKAYSEHEYETLKGVIAQRQSIGPASTASEVQAQEANLANALGRITVLAEQYPAIKADAVYTKTMGEVSAYEDKVRTSRMVYNDTVTKYNRLVRSLPGSLVAGALKFRQRDYLPDDVAKADMPSMVR